MKKLFLSLALFSICASVLAQKPTLKLYQSHRDSGMWYFMDIENVGQSHSIYIDQDESDTAKYEFKSAYFIFAPRHGEAVAIRFVKNKLPETAHTVLKNRAKVGDIIILDRVEITRNGRKVLLQPFACRIKQFHKFSEHHLKSDSISFSNAYGRTNVDGFHTMSRCIDVHFNYSFKVAYTADSLNGTIGYYDSLDNLISEAEYSDNELVSKTYYFPGSNPPKIRSTVERRNDYYLTATYYDNEGYMVASGTLAYAHRNPNLMPIKPIGFVKSPFDSLNLVCEYRPDGHWKVYNKNSEVIDSFILSSGNEGTHSIKMNGTTVEQEAVPVKPKKGLKLFKRKKKYRRLITPSF